MGEKPEADEDLTTRGAGTSSSAGINEEGVEGADGGGGGAAAANLNLSKSNIDRASGPAEGGEPAEATTVKSSKSNSQD